MKKKLLTLLAGGLLLTAGVPNAFAALTDAQQADIAKIEKEITGLRKQVVQKYVESGEITAEQGKVIQERIDTMEKYRAENGYGIGGFGNCGGAGMMGNGGMMGGGFGRMMGGNTL